MGVGRPAAAKRDFRECRRCLPGSWWKSTGVGRAMLDETTWPANGHLVKSDPAKASERFNRQVSRFSTFASRSFGTKIWSGRFPRGKAVDVFHFDRKNFRGPTPLRRMAAFCLIIFGPDRCCGSNQLGATALLSMDLQSSDAGKRIGTESRTDPHRSRLL